MELINRYFTELTALQISQFAMLGTLYEEWNDKINVVSRKDIENIYERHVLHSLAIAKVIQFLPGSKILDVGTGGGFPGIPLAILFPDVRFHLVDSIGKKIRVVEEVSKAIGLQNVNTWQERVENINDSYDFVVSRAVTELAELIRWTAKIIAKNARHEMANGIICLKGGDKLIEEISQVQTHVKTWQISEFFSEEFFETKKVVYVKI